MFYNIEQNTNLSIIYILHGQTENPDPDPRSQVTKTHIQFRLFIDISTYIIT